MKFLSKSTVVLLGRIRENYSSDAELLGVQECTTAEQYQK